MGPPSSWPLLLGWAAGADLATMAPVYCPPHAARTRGRELCPTDAVCAARSEGVPHGPNATARSIRRCRRPSRARPSGSIGASTRPGSFVHDDAVPTHGESRCSGFRCPLKGPGLARRPLSLPREPKERCSASTPSPRSASRGTHFATLGRRRRDLQTWQTASGRRRRVEGVAVISFIGRRRDQGSSAPPLHSVGGDRWC